MQQASTLQGLLNWSSTRDTNESRRRPAQRTFNFAALGELRVQKMSSGICVVGQERGSEGGSRECGEELRWKCRKMLRIIAGVLSVFAGWQGRQSAGMARCLPGSLDRWGSVENHRRHHLRTSAVQSCKLQPTHRLELALCALGALGVSARPSQGRHASRRPTVAQKDAIQAWCRFPVRLLGASHADSGRTTQSTQALGKQQ